MRPPPSAAMLLDNEDVDRVLCHIHSLPAPRADAESPVRVRLRYLQKIGFPASAVAGRGRRSLHSADELLQVAIAFQLLALGVPAKRAAATVVANWPDLRIPFVSAWQAHTIAFEKGSNDGGAAIRRLRAVVRFSVEGFDDDSKALDFIVSSVTEIAATVPTLPVLIDTEVFVDAYGLMGSIRSGLTYGLRMRDEDVERALDEAFGRRQRVARGTGKEDPSG